MLWQHDLERAAPLAQTPAASVRRPVLLRPIDGWDGFAMPWPAPAVGSVELWPLPLLAPVQLPSRSGPRPPVRAAAARAAGMVRRIRLAGDRISRLPYKWGGGHGSFSDSGYDCSGSVSYVLHAAGLLSAPEASGALTAFGKPGPGRRVTIYANSAHVLVTVDGRRFDTIALQSTGSRWAPQVGAIEGYVARHPAGL